MNTSGKQRIYVDDRTHRLMFIDSSGKAVRGRPPGFKGKAADLVVGIGSAAIGAESYLLWYDVLPTMLSAIGGSVVYVLLLRRFRVI